MSTSLTWQTRPTCLALPVTTSSCLGRISTAYWALIGEQPTPGAPVSYRLIERGTGREIHTLTAAMAASLLQEGWIEPSGEGDARRWGYRITLTGIQARDVGWE